jgi:hypothetical protein
MREKLDKLKNGISRKSVEVCELVRERRASKRKRKEEVEREKKRKYISSRIWEANCRQVYVNGNIKRKT